MPQGDFETLSDWQRLRHMTADERLDYVFETVAELRSLSQANHNLLLETNEQVKKTNGRVTKLEMWRATLAGAVGVIVLLAPFVLTKILE